MNSIQNHKHFLQFLVNCSNKKQNTNILKFIDNEQLKILQQISKNILDGNIPLTSKEFHDLYHHKIFLRKLRSGKISIKKILVQKYLIICKLVKIFLKHDAKISSSTFGTMGKNKRSKNTSERSDCESSSSESSEFQSSEEEEEFTNESEGERENSTEEEEEEEGRGEGKNYID